MNSEGDRDPESEVHACCHVCNEKDEISAYMENEGLWIRARAVLPVQMCHANC